MEEKRHYKLYKSGKNWVVAAVAAFTVLSGSGLASTALNVHAATPRVSATAKAARQAASDNLYKQIRWAQAYKASNYTASSFAALQNALNAGLKIFRNQNGKTTAQLNAATAAMHNAALKLVAAPVTPAAANVAALQTQLGWSTKYMQGANDDAALFTTLKADIATAQGYVADPSKASQSAVDSIAAALKKDGQAILDARANAANQTAATSADFQALEFALSLVSSQNPQQANFTPATWTPFAAALATAQKLDGQKAATPAPAQKDVQAATSSLLSTLKALVSSTGNNAQLAAAITTAQALNQADYTPASWDNLQAAVKQAQTINYATVNPTAQQISAALGGLSATTGALVKVQGSTTALNKEYITDKALKSTDYVDFSAVATALTTALNVLNGVSADGNTATTYSQNDINNALTALQNAVKGLKVAAVPSADNTALQNAITNATGSDVQASTNYTTDSWTAYATALATAKSLVNNSTALPSAVESAKTALNTAYAGLKLLTNQAATDATNAIAKFNKDYNLSALTSTPVTTAAVIAAFGNGKGTAPAVATLADFTTSANGVTPATYTGTFNDVVAAYTNLVNNNANTSIAPAVLEQSVKALNDALAALKFAPAASADVQALTSAINTAKGLTQSDYTPASWKLLADALTKATTALNNGQESAIAATLAPLRTAETLTTATPTAGTLVLATADQTAVANALAALDQASSINTGDYSASQATVDAFNQAVTNLKKDGTYAAGTNGQASTFTSVTVSPSQLATDTNAVQYYIGQVTSSQKNVASQVDVNAILRDVNAVTVPAFSAITQGTGVTSDVYAQYSTDYANALKAVQADVNNNTALPSAVANDVAKLAQAFYNIAYLANGGSIDGNTKGNANNLAFSISNLTTAHSGYAVPTTFKADPAK